MFFSIPADFKIDTIPKLVSLESKYPGNKIREVFGNLSGSKWPSGHGFLQSQKYANDLLELKQYIEQLDVYGIDFN